MQKSSQQFGIKIAEPRIVEAFPKNPKQPLQFVKGIIQEAKPEIIVTFVTNKNSPIYADMKYVCLKEIGILHQNVCEKSLQKNIMSVCSNIVLQMNAKIGKPLWTVENTYKNLPTKTMLVGIDVYQGKKGSAFIGILLF